MSFRSALAVVVLGAAGVLAVNAYVTPVPGLDWARPAGAPTGVSTDAQTGATTGGGAPATAEARPPRRRGEGGGGGGAGPGGRGGFGGPVPVTTAAATLADMPVHIRGVGTARALATVTVRAQVEGKLLKVHFREGQEVARGDLLAEIDPTTYRAQLDQAIAKRRLTEVQLANAKLDLDRVTSVDRGVVTQKAVDTQRAQVGQFEAQLKADAAAVANAEAVLGYTRIVSPITGRTGQRLVDEGNLVRTADAGLVTIAQIKPLSVQFTLPQQQLQDVKAAMTRGAVPVEALAADDRTVIDAGTLSFIDNQIDQTTGTVRMKAELPNERQQLWPGQFVNVRLRIDTVRDAVTVPATAIQRGPTGPFVLVLGPPIEKPRAENRPETGGASQTTDGKAGDAAGEKGPRAPRIVHTVTVRPVVVLRQTEQTAALSSGVAAGDVVVTSGFARLEDGTEVSVGERAGSARPPEPSTGAPPAGQPAAGETGSRGERRAQGERGGDRSRPTSTVVQ